MTQAGWLGEALAVSRLLLLLLVLLLGASHRADAQDADAATAEFELGSAAASASRWAEAESHFAAAYELSANPVALYNRAVALRALGRYAEALVLLGDVLRGLSEDAASADTARALMRELEPEVGSVGVVVVLPPSCAGTETLVNGVPLDYERAFDPGTVDVVVRAQGCEPFHWTGRLGRGQHIELEARLFATPRATSLWDEPWLWVMVGAVAAGGAVLVAVLADDAAQHQPETALVVRLP